MKNFIRKRFPGIFIGLIALIGILSSEYYHPERPKTGGPVNPPNGPSGIPLIQYDGGLSEIQIPRTGDDKEALALLYVLSNAKTPPLEMLVAAIRLQKIRPEMVSQEVMIKIVILVERQTHRIRISDPWLQYSIRYTDEAG